MIKYLDVVIDKPEVIILDGKYGEGYIYSTTNVNIMKPIHINFYSIRDWFESGSIQIVAMNSEKCLFIPKTIPWRLILEWCKCGAYSSYWEN